MSHGYYPPPGAAPQQQYGYSQGPPQGQWGQPQPNMGPGGPPPPHMQQPPQQFQQQPYGQQPWPPQGPPPQGYTQGHPMGQAPFQQGPHQGFGQPPMPPTMGVHQPYSGGGVPSPGYGPDIYQGNVTADIDALNRAMSGFRKDDTTIIRILSKTDPRYPAALRQAWAQRNGGKSLEEKISSSFRSHYADALLQLVRGPLLADVHNINRAIKGVGTKEDMLNDVLIGRSNADMHAIKAKYQEVFKKPLDYDVESDLSLKTKTMFQLIMRGSRTPDEYPYNAMENTRDVDALYHATRNPLSKQQDQVFTILTQRSDNQIRAIAHEYQQKYHKSLEDTIRSSFSGHMEDALVLALQRATDKAKADAYAMEAAMAGLGTKDDLLVNRTVRIHWDRSHLDQVKRAYQHFFKKDLISRVKGETSGDYKDCLVACLI